MTETKQLIATLKALLKQRGLTYRQIGEGIGLSEPSVKRLFSLKSNAQSPTLDRLSELCGLLGLTFAELVAQAQVQSEQIRTLSLTQERELVADTALLLVAVCVLNGWTAADICAMYKFSAAACIKQLLKLDKLGLITLLPGDRVRLKVARDFDWITDGPIQQYFRKQEKSDFLNSDFKKEGEAQLFLYGMLTKAAMTRLNSQLKKLRDEFTELHQESLNTGFANRHGVALLLAHRNWEPVAFAAMRR